MYAFILRTMGLKIREADKSMYYYMATVTYLLHQIATKQASETIWYSSASSFSVFFAPGKAPVFFRP